MEGCGPEGFLHGGLDGVELVVAGQLLYQLPAAVVVEDGEVLDEVEEPGGVAGPFEHYLQLRRLGSIGFFALHGPPGLEPLLAGAKWADARQNAIGDDLDLVHREHLGEFCLVGLELVPCLPDVGGFIGGVLQFDVSQGEPVYEEHDIQSAVLLVPLDGELVDGQPVVFVGVLEVDELSGYSAHRAVWPTLLHRDPVDEVQVEGPVPCFQGRPVRVGDTAEGRLQGSIVQVRVEPFQGIPQSSF